METTKKCLKCGEEKLLNCFYVSKINKSGYINSCKKCYGLICKKWSENNPDKVKEKRKRWIKNNPKKIKIIERKYRKSHLEKIKKNNKRYRENNREKAKIEIKIYRLNNREKCNKVSREWRIKNRKKLNKYARNRRKNNIHHRLKSVMSSRINERLKHRFYSKNGKSTFSFLPYTVDDLIKHLESQFKLEMSWENYGKWHIDHKKPDSSFKYKSVEDEEFQRCWALNNLQPLWAGENLKKSNKY